MVNKRLEQLLEKVAAKRGLGSAAAKPVHGGNKAKEHKPEVKQTEVHAGEQKAQEVKAPLIEENHEELEEVGQEIEEKIADKGELDYEGDMASGQLKVIIDAAVELHNMLEENEDANLPEWVQSKLTLAKEYIDTVRDYMKAEVAEDVIDQMKDSSEEETYSKEELEQVMEALNLDTKKYTFDYLAEAMGFKKAGKKKIAKSEKIVSNPSSGVLKVEPHDHADQEGQKVRAAVVHESEGKAAAKPVHDEKKAVEHTPAADNKDIIKGQHAEEVKGVIVEAAKAKRAPLKVKITPKKNVVIDKKGQLDQAAPSVTPATAVVTPAAPAKEGK
jgi:hypothetical protein